MNINFSIQPNFKSSCRRYTNKNGDEYGCYTTLFRSDLDWEKLSNYEINHFKNKDKINIIMFAASDGSEAYSKIISLTEKAKQLKHNAEKFFPIKAYDIDDEILKAAKSGYILASNTDIAEISCNSEDYTDYFCASEKELKIKDDVGFYGCKSYKAQKTLTNNVTFDKGDMFEKIKKINDNSNTILMCRNILGYFLNDKIEEFVKLASKFLKKDSLFVIGDFDGEDFNISELIEKNNFTKVMKNVFKKK